MLPQPQPCFLTLLPKLALPPSAAHLLHLSSRHPSPSYRLPIFRAIFPKYRHRAQMKGRRAPKYRQTALTIHIPVPPNDISKPQKTVTKYR